MRPDPWPGHRRARGGPYAGSPGAYRTRRAGGQPASRRPDSAVPSAPARCEKGALSDAIPRPGAVPRRLAFGDFRSKSSDAARRTPLRARRRHQSASISLGYSRSCWGKVPIILLKRCTRIELVAPLRWPVRDAPAELGDGETKSAPTVSASQIIARDQ
jgi:hypothetical protein|nr:MAG TPA: hypothetical protein [Caudoviricetes sp.]